MSGSDIANCVLKSALSASRNGDSVVSNHHFEKSIDEIKASQRANNQQSPKNTTVTTNVVSEEYVKSQIGETTMQELKND